MAIYLIVMYVASGALGYVMRFTQATLAMGRSLSDTGTPTGYQDAITPPRFSRVALAVYVLCLGGIICGFWQFGLLTGAGIVVGFLVALVINTELLLPKRDSEHFRKVILRSMIARHADYLKSGDALRASAMAMLLERAGIPVDEFTERLTK